ncbi:hypothetical protein [Sphingomonas sp. Y38-1Y]|uniref:hypothetical protein n=1 Tax=Sphingomonas sp. Y38-1Y TaxID=3078265 RepID=UPI0028ED631A|nr:hypothetical protein [Sphingomonas sp. Y38-1Y]
MDLSHGRFARDTVAGPGVAGLAMLLASAAARQAATPTARLAVRLATVGRTAGAFDRETARMLHSMVQG